MRISQYVYFSVFSQVATADEIGEYLGLQPDEVRVRASRSADPPRPRDHSWRLVSKSGGLCVDEHAATILDRLRPIEDRLVRIQAELLGEGGGCNLQVVRYFNDPEGEEEELDPPDAPLQKLAGQHQLLGWHLDSEALGFLVRVGAKVDFDEYG